jgi:hypothetical protein
MDAFALLDGSSVYRQGTDEEDVESDGSCADHDDYSCRGEDGGVWVVKGRKEDSEDGISDLHRRDGSGSSARIQTVACRAHYNVRTFGVMGALLRATNKLGQSGHAPYRSFKFGSISEDCCDLAVEYTLNPDTVSQVQC